MKIVVLAGGRSTERNVSISSGYRLTNALRDKGHQATFIDLFLGYDLNGQPAASVFEDANTSKDLNISDAILTDADINALRPGDDTTLFGPNVLDICKAADIVFLGLHGGDGENGKVQAVLDLNNIKYTGSGSTASGITMNKVYSKEIMLYHSIKTAAFVEITRDQGAKGHKLPFAYPVVLKPTSGGSSVGTHIVHNDAELESGLTDVFRFDNSAIIEEFIEGREFSLGVVNGHAFPAIEIKVHDGWYDFEHKFQPGHTDFITPPDDLDSAVHEEMKRVAVQTMRVLGMQNYGRVDFFANDFGVWVIEANNLPGMTPLSLLPQEAEAEGVAYPDLVESIVTGKLKIYEDGMNN
ncbi:MAG: ATP-grasp domain-containing protein [Lactobacillus sp.]|jgi:D-alanine-D-alanine ligase|uniref:D-alanine--D-alanine ligase n=1 Tax=Lacticaseibacillus suilingensis TaxID=2799577 RepID=A0ABW4BEG3_9LACO|nr:ATP-grasp domain-containing protein [Lacticaseibacillus suilingensis]MCI1894447.1 ATP-grasp domain-containing protein [Lactobacillus sp.]MCI1916905.1 ATP-grasp domain-containing protein [Lactobacillus sp.]MCI1941122.1 ATP-grasp domain-containing protein [Lactobacillus sp.]MCI1971665.1 ATP-grasp domain-containing protein [Lactobacillus sp.]MCI2016326.1 ATP-grasp domain-containing protein [Lactobacillus sp.]